MKKYLTLTSIFTLISLRAFADGVRKDQEPKIGPFGVHSLLVGIIIGLIIGYLIASRMKKN
jgi:hypothetical protein